LWYHTSPLIRSLTVDFKFAGPSRPKRNHLFWWCPDSPNPTRIIYYYNIVCTSISATRAVQIIVLYYYFPRTDPPARERFNCRNAAACVGGKQQLRLCVRISAVVADHGGRCYRSHVGNPFTVASHVICLRYEFPISK